MDKQYVNARKTGTEGSRPAACDGIDDDTLQTIAAEIAGKHASDDFNKAIDDASQSVDDFVNGLDTEAP
ncbi:hypothetical protein ABZU45_00660 [Streptomyces avermitilis]|uniref:hypothetical protein n=1 Tax=Streptomyces avermitilis TaxID=33903 RepID=UPI0033A8CEEA